MSSGLAEPNSLDSWGEDGSVQGSEVDYSDWDYLQYNPIQKYKYMMNTNPLQENSSNYMYTTWRESSGTSWKH